ncbi:unnamed protein product [Brassica oleracea]
MKEGDRGESTQLRQSHRKSSLRKPMIKVPPLASFICVPSTVPSLLFFIEQRIWERLVILLISLLFLVLYIKKVVCFMDQKSFFP